MIGGKSGRHGWWPKNSYFHSLIYLLFLVESLFAAPELEMLE